MDDVIAEQYAGTVQLAGVTVDRNSFRKDFVQPEEELDMATAAELQDQIDKLSRKTQDATAGVEFLAKLAVGDAAAIKFLSEIAVNHQGRIKALEQ